jgi:DUF4097 and DUF4098 domain-containing protein YvlB
MLMGCSNNDTKVTDSYSINEVENISVKVQSYQLIIRESTDDQIHVKYNGAKKEQQKVSVELSNSELNISQKDSSDNDTLFSGLSFGKTGEIDIYIPESYGKDLDISNGSGEAELSSLILSGLTISNNSGYLSVESVKADKGIFKSDSGDIKLKDSTIGNMNIDTESAYIFCTDNEASDVKICSASGEINISGLPELCNAYIENSSGDITISFKTSPKDLSVNIATNSDDISCKLNNIEYTTNIPSNKKGIIGDGNYILAVSSDEGTIIVR